jgi:hypothetical protein
LLDLQVAVRGSEATVVHVVDCLLQELFEAERDVLSDGTAEKCGDLKTTNQTSVMSEKRMFRALTVLMIKFDSQSISGLPRRLMLTLPNDTIRKSCM